ncbi:type I iodothyronine deiodinase-like isoform X1 [Glandiceps talaboti]
MMRATVHSGKLRRLFDDFKDRVDFLFVYTKEAHPANGWRMGSHYSFFDDAKTIEERSEAARLLIEADKKFTTFTLDTNSRDSIPIVLDNMDNDFICNYAAMPNRLYILNDGKFIFVGEYIDDALMGDPTILPSDKACDWMRKNLTSSSVY